MELTTQNIQKIARLARLKVDEKEIAALSKDLTNILNWVEQLNQVNTEAVEPMSSVILDRMPMRADQVTDGNLAPLILANAPEAQHDMFVVPKVVE
jgi:aspartyl-tRNA(Asn)/glutamyl-tRNA(Gln) amidotransferase subunit C